MNSECSSVSDELNNGLAHRTLFVCGFVAKRWHNSSLLSIIHDLLPHFYISCNNENWNGAQESRELISNADVMVFLVNEFTLNDNNCLKILQYAWHLMIPIIMLRPPRTKLVISKKANRRTDIYVGNGSISRIASEPIGKQNLSSIDYNLLQDILYEGYKNSVVYDRLEHAKSMTKIQDRLEKLFKAQSTPSPFSSERPPFFLSPSNRNNASLVVSAIASEADVTEQPSNGISNLDLNDEKKNEEPKEKPTSTHTTLKHHSSWGYMSSLSKSSSMERRMSLNHLTLDDLANYQQTQYLVFPLRDGNKKPTLIKFPDDLIEETYNKDESVWGSDTSLEEEAQIAPKINTGISIDLDESSPISSPPPYIDHI